MGSCANSVSDFFKTTVNFTTALSVSLGWVCSFKLLDRKPKKQKWSCVFPTWRQFWSVRDINQSIDEDFVIPTNANLKAEGNFVLPLTHSYLCWFFASKFPIVENKNSVNQSYSDKHHFRSEVNISSVLFILQMSCVNDWSYSQMNCQFSHSFHSGPVDPISNEVQVHWELMIRAAGILFINEPE